MTTPPPPPPEAQLITRLREAKIPKLSMRSAARQAGVSPTLWVETERGFRRVAPGVTLPTRVTPDKLARMARIVGASPKQLTEAGRGDAAAILKRITDAGPELDDRVIEAIRASQDFTERQKQALIEIVERNKRDSG